MIRKVTSVFWPIARRCRYLRYPGAKESLVSFSHDSFADQSANDDSANVPNVAQVTFLFWPIARR